MKYLLQAIDARRDCVRLSDHELRDLLIEVRSGKDDRIEFTESMVRLLDELKSSEHATAFLTKVAKRDAPDYYDVIKNPMDLGTMMRNVRQGRYKSKAQFMRDLDLIWDNCLTYNSEPTHPLRRSVQMLRAKANHLLTYVNDTNDVKEALNQWQASLGLQRRPSEPLDGARKDTEAGAGDQSASGIAGRDGTASSTFGLGRIGGAAVGGGAGGGVTAMIDTPFEQRPALLRNADGMSTFQRLDASLSALDEEFARRYLNAGAGPSRRALDFSAEQGLSAAASLDMLKTLEGPQGGLLRRALTMPPRNVSKGVASPDDSDQSSIPYPLESEDPEREAHTPRDAGAAWWNSMAHPSLLPAGVMPLESSEQTTNKRVRFISGRPGKRRRKIQTAPGLPEEEEDGKLRQQYVFGGVDALEKNVRTIVRLRRTHTKYGRLNSHIESGEPIPADLGVISSDEDGGGDDEDEDDDENEKDRRTTQGRAHTPKARRKAPDALALPILDLAGNPFAKLSGEKAYDMLQSKTNVLLAHTGFDGSHKAASDVLADVAGEFLMNVGRTLRNYTDRFAHEMSVEDLVLHTLYENGGIDVRSLESYVADDVLRYGNKMSDLLRKLRASYRDTLANADLTMADEAAYFGAEAQVGRAEGHDGVQAGADSEGVGDGHILRGGYARELADEDFFGFKDMGLDAELGIDVGRQLAAMPSRMFSRRANEDAAGVAGGVGVNAKNRLGGGSGESGRSLLDFEPPPPYVPLSEASIAAQIGLLRPFYRDLMRTRGQWQRIGGGDEESTAAIPTAITSGVGDGDRTEMDDHKDVYVILPDEEQERQRYKVPPTGKMPRRAMKQRSVPQQTNTVTAAATSNGKPTNAQSTARKTTGQQQQQGAQSKSNGTGAASAKSKAKSSSGGGGGGKKKDASGNGSGHSATKQQQQHTAHAVAVS